MVSLHASPRLGSCGPLLRGRGTDPPETLDPLRTYFPFCAQETKIFWKLPSQGLVHKRELREESQLASYRSGGNGEEVGG
jgi:hypothetical protein